MLEGGCGEDPDAHVELGFVKGHVAGVEAGRAACAHAEVGGADVRAFLRYVDGKAAEGAFVQALDTEVKAIKQHKETRREYMTLAMELKRMFAEGEKTGEEKGAKKKETMMILAMLQDGVAKEAIAKYAKVSVEYITELGKKNHLL